MTTSDRESAVIEAAKAANYIVGLLKSGHSILIDMHPDRSIERLVHPVVQYHLDNRLLDYKTDHEFFEALEIAEKEKWVDWEETVDNPNQYSVVII